MGDKDKETGAESIATTEQIKQLEAASNAAQKVMDKATKTFQQAKQAHIDATEGSTPGVWASIKNGARSLPGKIILGVLGAAAVGTGAAYATNSGPFNKSDDANDALSAALLEK